MKFRRVAIVGATGLVGKEVLSILEERDFPCEQVFLYASDKSIGTKLTYFNKNLPVRGLDNDTFDQIDLAFFSAGAEISREYVPIAREFGTVVIDKSSVFRMQEGVPLVVPEVNPNALVNHEGLIANPNCSTIQMVLALYPLHKLSRIVRVVVSTYQGATGAGKDAKQELWNNLERIIMGKVDARSVSGEVFPRPISMNVIPQIGDFDDDGFCSEESKLIDETHKILEDVGIIVSPTTVRVPVDVGHSQAIYVETENELQLDDVKQVLMQAPGINLAETDADYPTPLEVAGRDEVFVGRLRRDRFVNNGLHLWVVGDNLRKGAALNAIQIAELLGS